MGADPEKAIAYMRALGRLDHPGACLHYVWLAYKTAGARTSHPAVPSALEAWNASDGKHRGDRNPPRGVPVWWGAKRGSDAGDVVISLGGGRVIATDQPRYGAVGETTIAGRERLIGRPYLGWSESIFDAPISLASTAGAVTRPASHPIALEEDDIMKLIRWNSHHVFAVGREAIYHVPTVTEQATLEVLCGPVQDVDDAGLTASLNVNGIHWDAVDAVLRGVGPLSGGRYWSRLAAEGEAIRGGQAAQEKTLADVLATAQALATS